MKNLHVLPTDKPSRVFKDDFGKYFISINIDQEQNHFKPQHIYITSDEEIKEDDWMIWNNRVVQAIDTVYYSGKKIILTTDQDLIADGVQAIDDEFLESFVKNPSCEHVKTDLVPVNYFGSETIVNSYGFNKFIYKIIIPQEEPKQETLEEAAKRLYQKGLKDDLSLSFHDGVKFGAVWQAERMYSEEEVLELLHKRMTYTLGDDYKETTTTKWFEQFKKKGGDK